MLSAWTFAVIVATNPSTPAEMGRSGLWGWGLGLELPMVGIATGLATKSKVGWGYNLGGAVVLEVTPQIELRLYGAGGETKGGRAPLTYFEGGVERGAHQDAGWLGIELGAGATYLFRQANQLVTPYVGADFGGRFSGFLFDDNQSPLDKLQAPTSSLVPTSGHNDDVELGWTLGVRGGARLELATWLATLAELHISYVPLGHEIVSNTLPAPQVYGVPQAVWLVRATFSVRLGL